MRLMQVLIVSLMVSLAGCSDSGGDDGDSDGNGVGGGDGAGSGNGGGDGGDGGVVAPPEEVTLAVSLEGLYPATIAFQPSALSVPAGSLVTLTFTNDDINPVVSHDWALEGFEDTAKTATVANGQSASVTFLAPSEPGDYTFYCTVPGHRANGMEGTLTVT